MHINVILENQDVMNIEQELIETKIFNSAKSRSILFFKPKINFNIDLSAFHKNIQKIL